MAYCRNAFPLVRKAFGAVERIGSKSGEASHYIAHLTVKTASAVLTTSDV
jgi:hypothetical protein